jgi:hypothetical protein
MTSVDHLPNDAESLKRLLLARGKELVALREAQASTEAEELARGRGSRAPRR